MSLFHRILERTRPPWVRCLILAAIGIAVRLPALSGELIWDDPSLVRDNPFVKSPLLFLESFRHYLALDGSSTHYRPIQNISYFFDYLFWNGDPLGYHVSNVFSHVGSGLLLYLLLRRLKPDSLSAVAFFVALGWMVHPVHSAAVDYISGRADSLAFFFACSAWLSYLKARTVSSRLPRHALWFGAGMLALASLCSRETGCVWVLLFLFHLFVIDRETSIRAKTVVAGVCVGIVAIYAGLRQLPADSLHVSPSAPLAMTERAGLMLRALGDYGRLMILPWNLHLERTVSGAAASYLSALGLLLAAVLLYGAFRKGTAQSIRIFGAGWFLLAYLPISNLFPLNATVAEHWLYLPSVGLFIFVAGCALEWTPRWRPALVAVGCIALVGFSARSFVRSGDWITSETFYRHELAAGSTQTRFVLNLAQTYAAQKEYSKAEALLRKLLIANPNYAMAQNALGHLFLEQGRTEEAENIFAEIARRTTPAPNDQPRSWIAALNLAFMKNSAHDSAAALAILDEARANYPDTWRLIGFESEILRNTGQSEKALALVEQFRATHWWHCAAAIEAGRIHLEQRRYADAEEALSRASWLDIHDAESLNLMAALNLAQNRIEAAFENQRRAVRRQPDQPRQYVLLSDVLERLGRHEEAQAALAQVHSLQALAKAN